MERRRCRRTVRVARNLGEVGIDLKTEAKVEDADESEEDDEEEEEDDDDEDEDDVDEDYLDDDE